MMRRVRGKDDDDNIGRKRGMVEKRKREAQEEMRETETQTKKQEGGEAKLQDTRSKIR